LNHSLELNFQNAYHSKSAYLHESCQAAVCTLSAAPTPAAQIATCQPNLQFIVNVLITKYEGALFAELEITTH